MSQFLNALKTTGINAGDRILNNVANNLTNNATNNYNQPQYGQAQVNVSGSGYNTGLSNSAVYPTRTYNPNPNSYPTSTSSYYDNRNASQTTQTKPKNTDPYAVPAGAGVQSQYQGGLYMGGIQQPAYGSSCYGAEAYGGYGQVGGPANIQNQNQYGYGY